MGLFVPRYLATSLVILFVFSDFVLGEETSSEPINSNDQLPQEESREFFSDSYSKVHNVKQTWDKDRYRPIAIPISEDDATNTDSTNYYELRKERVYVAPVDEQPMDRQPYDMQPEQYDLEPEQYQYATYEDDRGRGLMKHTLHFFRNNMGALLLAYKFKLFTLVPLTLGALLLLAGSTSLAGFFFTLFAAAMTLGSGGA